MFYNIISTGSKGNALVIEDNILIDCGVSFTKLKNVYKNLSIVLLTHIHTDHFNKTTIKRLALERPTLRFACCNWLVNELVQCGVNKRNIDVLNVGVWYNYGGFKISPILLYHNVDQCGYRLFINNKKVLYATDTNKLDGITAPGYDYYFIEANYTEDGIQERIKAKEALGLYCYEYDAMLNHLSKEKCDEFLYENMGVNSHYEYMHGHKEREEIK
jgi:Cft2 family RNA processing exonuclease